MSARERILNRLRGALRADGGPGARAAAVDTRLGAPVGRAPRPSQSRREGAARVEEFMKRATAADATVSRIATMEELPTALSHELRQRNLGQTIRMGDDPTLGALDWSDMDVSRGPGRLEEPATLSTAPYGLAETGTLALCSGPDNPVTLTFLGETHFVALRASDIHAGFEELFAAHRASGRDPRTLNFVTGPSRSADIGQVLQLGAHGPVALHIFVVGDEAS
ncbi:lactate utilization protein [Pikeienuella piscinae]|uniref:Lactate utilization protein n=1 Tax=Pikeienuella piscinae TaxID=2748098 RepID=A0A7L5C274_9RHOB|nr:lactate utilization protein [Pikeienuella piscinae]QIE56274.1 lactate utilization protein [Pikeienuella piscinae]